MQDLIVYPKFKAVDGTGTPYAGAKLYTYEAGTLTAKTTYSSTDRATANANPVVLDSNGEAVVVAGEGSYRLILKTSDDATTIFDIDNVAGMLGPVVVTTYTNETAIQGASGNVDGEMAIDASNGNKYTWDDDNTKWRVGTGNIYSSDPSSSTYTIETGTVIFNTSLMKLRYWNGSAFADVVASSFTAASAPGAIFSRPLFAWASTTSITITPFALHHQGTTEQIVYSDSSITFTFGPSGSNSDSDALANNDWFYLYIDDSAVVTKGSADIAAAQLVAITEEPAWDGSKHGWYGQTQTSDRCIGAFKTDGSAHIAEFVQSGDFVQFGDAQDTAINATDIDNDTDPSTCTTLALDIPVFATRAQITATRSDNTTDLVYRTRGLSGTTGHYLIWTYRRFGASATVITDSSQTIDLWASASGSTTFTVKLDGWYYPSGM